MLHSRLRFLSSLSDECTGNREPGAMGSCSATAGGLRLGSLGLESDALGSPSALWARDRDNQLFRGLGQRWVRADVKCFAKICVLIKHICVLPKHLLCFHVHLYWRETIPRLHKKSFLVISDYKKKWNRAKIVFVVP